MFCDMQNCVTLQRRSERNIPYMLKFLKCKKGVSAATNMWFEEGHITIKQSLELVSWLHHMQQVKWKWIKKVYDYCGFCREVCYVIVMNSENVIGGEGKNMQIDESHIYTRKYHRGRFLKNEWKQIWVFGGIEKESNNCFITIVQKRDKDTLCDCYFLDVGWTGMFYYKKNHFL